MILTDIYGVTLMIIVNMTKGRMGFRKGGKAILREVRGARGSTAKLTQDLPGCTFGFMQDANYASFVTN